MTLEVCLAQVPGIATGRYSKQSGSYSAEDAPPARREDVMAFDEAVCDALRHLFRPVSTASIPVEGRFLEAARDWRDATRLTSSMTEIVSHPAYQRIIGMGRDVVPLLLRELARQPDHWFWALHSITGENPVPREHEGDLERMTDAWLRWGQAQRLVT